MKRKVCFWLAIIVSLFLFTGCSNKDAIPDVVKNTKGSEKWENPVDYANEEYWISAKDTGKAVDVIYFYPTTFTKAGEGAPDISDIDDVEMRAKAQIIYHMQAAVFEEDCNIYMPVYRQISAPYALTLSEQDSDALFRYSASQDPANALDYYFEHYNNGKPFILAGHSQGSMILTMLLSDYMEEHPEYYARMIAAYVIGYSVTEEYLEENPHLKFAECAEDTGVIISYNTEGPGNKDSHNAVVRQGAISINPINWKRDTTYASVLENKGGINGKGEFTKGFADARIDAERGVVVCESVDPAIYAISEPASALFGPESYHSYDYSFYHMNLRENVKTRIASFME